MIDRPGNSSPEDVHAAELEPDDESFLDDVFDRATTCLVNGEPADVEAFTRQRPHLAERVAEAVRLATEIWGSGPACQVHTVPGYEVVRELGRGGMGTVFLAKQLALADRLVALKVMPHGAALSQQARARFRSEIEALARIRHRHVIDIYDVIDIEATPAYAMEWVDGRSLLELVDDWVAMQKPPNAQAFSQHLGGDLDNRKPAELVAEWGLQVADALMAAHREGLLHRDVKPSNIMVRRDGTALLTDFGLVRDEGSSLHTRSGAFLGTPAYASPEQLRGEVVDERSDVYGLGATLYHALTGTAPFGNLRPAEMLRAVESGNLRPVRKLGVPIDRDLATIVESAMEVTREHRYASTRALYDDLQRYLQGRSIQARPESLWSRTGKFVRRNRSSLRGALIGSVVAIFAAALIAMYVVQQARLPQRFAEHVREAHLSMLDPLLDERMSVMLHDGEWTPLQHRVRWRKSRERHEASNALAAFDCALELIEDPAIRAERETLMLARTLVGEPAIAAGLVELAPQTHAFAARWRGVGRAPAVASIDFVAMSRLDRRCLGLLALLCGADSHCVAAWHGLDLADEPDPLVDAALGQLYRQQSQAALAWPRLERAAKHFREAEFLLVAIAEVAHASGDSAYALRVLERMPADASSAYHADERIRADVLNALGRVDEARALYLKHAAVGNVPPSSHESLATFFAQEEDYARAFHHCWRLQLRWPARARARPRLVAVLEAWWHSLSREGRIDLVRDSLATPGTFLDGLQCALDQQALPETCSLTPLSRQLLEGELSLVQARQFDAAQQRDLAQAVVAGSGLPDDVRGAAPCNSLAAPGSLAQGPIELLSLTTSGQPANGACRSVAVSADGRIVAFSSVADNLHERDRNGSRDVFVRDRTHGTTRCISLRGDGATASGASMLPAVSADGSYVAFYSAAFDLCPADRADPGLRCFVYDRSNGTITCLNERIPAAAASATGLQEAPRSAPQLSEDGSRVLFACGGVQAETRFVLWSEAAGDACWMSPVSGRGWNRSASALRSDGAVVLVDSLDAELLPDDQNAWMTDVFAFSLASAASAPQRWSERRGRSADCECRLVGATPDLRWSLLETTASNLVTIDNPSDWNLLVRDGESKDFVRVNEVEHVGFQVSSGGDTTGWRTVFGSHGPVGSHGAELADQVWFLQDRQLHLLSRTPTGVPGQACSREPCISDDGTVVVFTSVAMDLSVKQIGDQHRSARGQGDCCEQVFVVTLPR